jgi:hypothetical protein
MNQLPTVYPLSATAFIDWVYFVKAKFRVRDDRWVASAPDGGRGAFGGQGGSIRGRTESGGAAFGRGNEPTGRQGVEHALLLCLALILMPHVQLAEQNNSIFGLLLNVKSLGVLKYKISYENEFMNSGCELERSQDSGNSALTKDDKSNSDASLSQISNQG